MVENGDAEEMQLAREIEKVLDEDGGGLIDPAGFNQDEIDEEAESMNMRVEISIRKEELVSEEMARIQGMAAPDLGDIEVNDD
jgi:hypothetical protein